MGKAIVTIDGETKGTFDLYSANPVWNHKISFGSLGAGPHKIVIKVTGAKNSSAIDSNVALDGFLVGDSTTAVQDTAITVQYNSWIGQPQGDASSSGSYRVSGASARSPVSNSTDPAFTSSRRGGHFTGR